MTFTAQQINQLLGGELVGDASRTVCTIAGIETAAEGALCFLSDAKYVDYLATTKASVVIVTRSLLPASGYATGAALILVDNARAAMGQLLRVVEQTLRPARRGIEQPSFIAEGVTVPEDAYVGAMAYIGHNVKLSEGVQIYPQVYIGDNVTIGAHTVLYPGVKVYYNCVIGADCVLHGGVIVGGDGFGFEPDAQGVYQKVPQIGTVVIEDDVEIGANTTIDRAMMGETRIGKNTKIDNLCQVAHNVQIGQSTILCAQVGIAGSTSVGSHCMLTGQVGVAGHIAITDGCIFGAQSGVSGNVTKPGQYMGSPAIDAARWRRAQAVYRNLPEIYKKIK